MAARPRPPLSPTPERHSRVGAGLWRGLRQRTLRCLTARLKAKKVLLLQLKRTAPMT